MPGEKKRKEESEGYSGPGIDLSYQYASSLVQRCLSLLSSLETGKVIDVSTILGEVRILLSRLRSSLFISDVYIGKMSDTRFEYIMKKLEDLNNNINIALEHLDRKDIPSLRAKLYEIDRDLLLYYQALSLIGRPAAARNVDSVIIGMAELPEETDRMVPEYAKPVLAYIQSRKRVTMRELVRRFGNAVIDILEDLKRLGLIRSGVDKRGEVIYLIPQ
ncbi:MAG: hypothetical protein GXO26_08305 [Crenarchaeota archaeon]|nr:hypothetical protein [Thermoproteota archaeon]